MWYLLNNRNLFDKIKKYRKYILNAYISIKEPVMNKYIDYALIQKYPNKYKLKPENIKKLKILDWDRLKKNTWYNRAMLSGTWWCHLEGCSLTPNNYDDESEFWIGFNEDNNKVDYRFSAGGGMLRYLFDDFYKIDSIENIYDMNMQTNTIRWLNKMIDEKILGL